MGLLRHDALITLADAVVTSTFWVSTRLRKPPVPAVVERTIALKIADRQVVAHDQDVVALTFVSADGSELPRWHPGSHLDIHLPSGLVRQYSLCGDPNDAHSYRIAVRRIPGGGGGSV